METAVAEPGRQRPSRSVPQRLARIGIWVGGVALAIFLLDLLGVPVDDWIEVGALAAPEKGKRFGKVLHRERVHMASGKGTYTFTTDELPAKAGIDPLLLLIDRVPDDNMVEVTIQP